MAPHLWPLHLKFPNHGKRCTYYEYKTACMKDVIALVSDESFAEGNFLGFWVKCKMLTLQPQIFRIHTEHLFSMLNNKLRLHKNE